MKNLKLKSIIALFLFVASYSMEAQTPHHIFSGTGELTCDIVRAKVGDTRTCPVDIGNFASAIPFTATITGYTKIGYQAFAHYLNLTAVTISSSVKEIGDEAFPNCGLSTLTFEGTTPPIIAAYAFSSAGGSGLTINIPSNAMGDWYDVLLAAGISSTVLDNSGIENIPIPPPYSDVLAVPENGVTYDKHPKYRIAFESTMETAKITRILYEMFDNVDGKGKLLYQ